MRKQYSAIIVIALLLVAGCSSTQTGKPVIKVGIILALSGPNAMLGGGARNAIVMAMDSLDETKYEYELIFEDDRLESKITSIAANKLLSVDNVDVIMSMSSGSGNVVSPMAQENKVIHFGVASDHNVAKGEYNFIHATPPSEEVEKWIEVANEKGISEIGILALIHDGVEVVVQELEKEVGKNNIKIIARENFNAGERNFRTALTKIKESNPDIILVETYSPEIEIIGKQHKELGINIPLSTIESFDFTDEKDLFNGYWYVSLAEPSNSFREEYEERYSISPVIATPNYYDLMLLAVRGFEEARQDNLKPTNEEVLPVIKAVDGFEGALGPLKVNEQGIIISPASLKEIRDGEIVVIS